MDAKTTCELILKQLKASNLNFVLQETPFSAFITIQKSLIKNISSVPSSIFHPVSDSVETLNKKIEALVIENSCLKKDLTEQQSEMKKTDTKNIKLEQNLKSTKDQIHQQIEGFKKVENILVEKEKKIVELKEVINSLNGENVTIRDKLQNISRSLKINEKEASKAKAKIENLESTVEKLKIDKYTLQKSLKKVEKSQKKKEKLKA